MTANPLVWLHVRLSGNPRMPLYMACGYVGLVAFFTVLSLRLSGPRAAGGVYSAWLGVISAVQALLLLVMIPNAVHRAVQRDFRTGMIDSHRVSPMGNLQIVAGYLLGPALPTLGLFAAGLLMGLFFAARVAVGLGTGVRLGAQVVVGGWVLGQGALLLLCLMLSSIALLAAVAAEGTKFNLLGTMFVIAVFGGWVVFPAVPGLSLLAGLLSAERLIGTISRGTPTGGASGTIALASLLQALFAVVFITAAARRFRRLRGSLFTIPLSLVLLALWALTLVLGMAVHQPAWVNRERDEFTAVQLGASTVAFLIVSLFALHAAAAERLALDRADALGQPVPQARKRCLEAMPLLCGVAALVLLGIMAAVCEGTDRPLAPGLAEAMRSAPLWIAVGLAMVLTVWADYNIFYAAGVLNVRAWVVLLLTWGVLRAGPPALDGLVASIVHDALEREWTGWGLLTGCSPIGTMILTQRPSSAIWTGLAAQAGLLAVTVLLRRRTQRRILPGTHSG